MKNVTFLLLSFLLCNACTLSNTWSLNHVIVISYFTERVRVPRFYEFANPINHVDFKLQRWHPGTPNVPIRESINYTLELHDTTDEKQSWKMCCTSENLERNGLFLHFYVCNDIHKWVLSKAFIFFLCLFSYSLSFLLLYYTYKCSKTTTKENKVTTFLNSTFFAHTYFLDCQEGKLQQEKIH